ncbi:hypothetical protein L6164_004130 [Bauhinia variegata]|uniref:Uncharacterized protein n=1 Tax=Bauhinia variegata TaxID=167791 RepID=A0ACB9Q2K3_BAUVA|nr:hypothetical protein L6164_004130 [Bauhinia variegata]
MPLLAEIANAQPSFQNLLCSPKVQRPFHNKLASISFAFSNEQRAPYAWKSLEKLKKANLNVGRLEFGRSRLLIKAVATLEPRQLAANEDKCMGSKNSELGVNPNPPGIKSESSKEKSTELDDREKLRRIRISKANKGNTPWNKGRKHSPETLQRIRERTRLAMQNPKVKMKLVNLGHAQSEETKLKIGVGVRMGWKKRREKETKQETCLFEWQNLIAEASRQGYIGEEELQWNSYRILDEQLKEEWLESVEQRKKVPKTSGNRRAPKSLEQRRKITETISAKWNDPEYRSRVCTALAKYHGTEPGTERKPRKRPPDGTQAARRSSTKKKANDISLNTDNKVLNQQARLKRSKYPIYKDPFVRSKLEMIKNIRAQRAADETKQTEAIERARLLIAEAEKAAKALEVAATKSPSAQASLAETRKLIAEAIQSLESIEKQQITESSVASTEDEKEAGTAFEVPNQSDVSQVNGHNTSASSDYKFSDDFRRFSLQKLLNGDQELKPTTSNGCASFPFGFGNQVMLAGSTNQSGETERGHSSEYKPDAFPTMVGIESIKEEKPTRPVTVTRKWIRGRLVEVVEETQ